MSGNHQAMLHTSQCGIDDPLPGVCRTSRGVAYTAYVHHQHSKNWSPNIGASTSQPPVKPLRGHGGIDDLLTDACLSVMSKHASVLSQGE
jgi:hypothetical protein